jgi:ABC-type branched-subunit amino acid transport system substrate-binding protein
MKYGLFCLLFPVFGQYLESLLITGFNTPPSFLDELSDFSHQYNISSKSLKDIIEGLESLDFVFLIDATFEPLFYPLLNNLASYFDTFYFSLNPADADSWSFRRFNLHPSYLQQAKAIQNLLETLNWTEFSLVSSTEYSNLKLANHINTRMEESIESYSKYSYDISQNDLDKFVARILKANVIRKLVIIDKGRSLDNIQKSINNTKFIAEGSSLILSSESIYSTIIDGSLIIVEKGLENSTSSDNYHYLSILNAISNLKLRLSEFSNIKKETVFKIVNELYPNHITCILYSLVNLQYGNKIIIGEIGDKLYLKGLIHYPNNITNFLPSNIKLVISISNSTTEIYNYYNYTEYISITNGALFAVNEINSKNEIPGYKIDLFSTGCGILLYNPSWYTNCYSKVIDKLGIAYINSPSYMATYGDLVTIKSLGKTLPQIGVSLTYKILDDNQAFPEFVKLIGNIETISSNLNIFYSSLGWFNKCIITDRGEAYLETMLEVENSFNIHNINSEFSRLFPTNYSRNDFDQYRSYFQDIKDSRCGVLKLSTTRNLPYYEALYDIGFRKGDIQIIADHDSVGELNTQADQVYKDKWNEIGANHLNFGNQAWVGEIGQNLLIEMINHFETINGGTCRYYDIITILKTVIKYILSKGSLLEDPNNFMKVLRATKIVGCSGTISFDPSSNSPLHFPSVISQVDFNQTTGLYFPVPSVVIRKYSSMVITYLTPLNFPNGIPPTLRPDNSCPFDSYLIQNSTKGMSVFYFISFIFLIVSITVGWYSFKCFKKNFTESVEKKVVSISDFVFMSYFIFQYFQIVNHVPNQFYNCLSMDLIEYNNFTHSRFWTFYECLIAFCTLWNFICLSKICFRNFIINIEINEHVLPVIGHICFMPLFSMLVDLYICDKSIGNSFTDSYLKFDCTSFCYTGKHLIHAILGTFVIIGFLAFSIYLRPIWESIQSCLHFNTNSFYISMLSVFQVLVVMVSKLFKYDQQIANGCILCALIVLFIGVTVYMKPYNDDRICILQLISLSCSLWKILITTIFINLTFSSGFVGLEILGIVIIVIVGVIKALKKDSIIYFEKNLSISSIFYNYLGWRAGSSFGETTRS